MNTILDKIDRLQKHDAFSDFRSNFFTNTLGLSQATQDLANQSLNFGASLLPPGGQGIPNPPIQDANQSSVMTTFPSAISQIFGPKIAGIPIVALVAAAAVTVIIIKRK